MRPCALNDRKAAMKGSIVIGEKYAHFQARYARGDKIGERHCAISDIVYQSEMGVISQLGAAYSHGISFCRHPICRVSGSREYAQCKEINELAAA